MTPTEITIVYRALAIAVCYFLYCVAKPYFKPIPPSPNATLLRKRLRDKMRSSRKAPKLCGYHIGSYLRPGQMALLDGENCEICASEDNKSA